MVCTSIASEAATIYIVRDLQKHLMIVTVADLKTLQNHSILTWLLAKEDFRVCTYFQPSA
jgi:hypothetical protein